MNSLQARLRVLRPVMPSMSDAIFAVLIFLIGRLLPANWHQGGPPERSKRNAIRLRIAVYITLAVSFAAGLLGTGLLFEYQSNASSFNSKVALSYSTGSLNLLPSNPLDSVRAILSVDPLVGTINLEAAAYLPSGKLDHRARIAVLDLSNINPNSFPGQFSIRTPLPRRERTPGATLVKDYRPPEHCASFGRASAEPWITADCKQGAQVQVWVLGQLNPDAPQLRGNVGGYFYLSPGPTVVGSRTITVNAPGINIDYAHRVPSNYYQAINDLATSFSSPRQLSTISYCLPIPAGFAYAGANEQLTYLTWEVFSSSSVVFGLNELCVPGASMTTTSDTTSSNAISMTLDSSYLSGVANEHALLGGILIGIGGSIFATLLLIPISRLLPQRQGG